MSNESHESQADLESQSESDTLQLITFEVNDNTYALPTLVIEEVIEMVSITPTPGTSDIFEGIIDLRGEVIPVVDLYQRIYQKNRSISQGTRILIVEIGDYVAGLIVDKVVGIQTYVVADFVPPPRGLNNHDHTLGILNQNGIMLIYLDLVKLLNLDLTP